MPPQQVPAVSDAFQRKAASPAASDGGTIMPPQQVPTVSDSFQSNEARSPAAFNRGTIMPPQRVPAVTHTFQGNEARSPAAFNGGTIMPPQQVRAVSDTFQRDEARSPATSDGGKTAAKDFEDVCLQVNESEHVAQSIPRAQGKQGKGCISCNLSRFITCGVILAIAIGGIVALLVALSGPDGPAAFFIPVDPPGASEAHRWSIADRDGLTLRVSNALDDFWTPYFDRSIEEWENGDPDVLTLLPERDPHDPECKPTRGRLRVCNGDYGNTDWQGLNIVLLTKGGDKIVQSVSKMNDYHIRDASEARRRYTMCHEFGHGFGLPHTDENHYNKDRGDCMDYTVRPENNLLPGSFNFGVLNELYGPQNFQTASPPSAATPPNRPPEDDRRLGEPIDDGPLPEDVEAKYYEAVAELEAAPCYDIVEDPDDRRLVVNHHRCQKDLGNGYIVEVHQLPVLPEE